MLHQTPAQIEVTHAKSIHPLSSICGDVPSSAQSKMSLSASARLHPNDVHTLLQSLHADHAQHVSKGSFENSSWYVSGRNAIASNSAQSRTSRMFGSGVPSETFDAEDRRGCRTQDQSNGLLASMTLKNGVHFPSTWEVPMTVDTCSQELALGEAPAKIANFVPSIKKPKAHKETRASELKGADLCEHGIHMSDDSTCTSVRWVVHAQRIHRSTTQVASPAFSLKLAPELDASFRILLYATTSQNGGDFRKSNGCGRIVLKCEDELPETCSGIEFSIGVGSDEKQEFRGPAFRNFFEHSCHGLDAYQEEWDFKGSVDESNNFVITLRITPKSNGVHFPSTWEVPLIVDTCPHELALGEAPANIAKLAPSIKKPKAHKETRASQLKGADLCELGIHMGDDSTCTSVRWVVPAQKIQRSTTQVASPAFSLKLAPELDASFRILLYATTSQNGRDFRKSKGCGRIVLKCEDELPETCSGIEFSIGVGSDEKQEFRGPAFRNFFEHSCHGLDAYQEEWDFKGSVDESNNFVITLRITPKS